MGDPTPTTPAAGTGGAAERERDRLRAENERLRQGKDRFKAGVRTAITWLHAYGNTMKDGRDTAVLQCAADRLGSAMAYHGRLPTCIAADGSPVAIWREAALAATQPSGAENDRLRARLGDAPADATPSNPEHDHHG